MDVDDDIQFDFFDDDQATREAASPRARLPGRAAPRRRAGPPRGTATLVRLLLLVGFFVFLVLVFGLLIQSCASASKHDAYARYMSDVGKIAAQSSANGKALSTVLTTPGLSVAQIETRLRGIADQEQQNVAASQSLNPPGRLRDESIHVVEALELRVNGVEGLAQTFQQTANSKATSKDAALLAAQAERLTASDVVWDDLFTAPAEAQLQHDGVSGVSVPDSNFVATPDLMTARSMTLVLQRIRGASTGAPAPGLHGTDIGSVTAQPGGQVLSASSLTTVTATTDLSFAVVVENGGDSQEVQIPVTLTIDRPQTQGGPIVKTQTIAVINPGESSTVSFSLNGAQVPFASQTTVRVDVKAVPGETNTSNNSYSYPVIFSLP
ncbi:MAG TPA: CARDB domain-containing protein [Gaiellaceae bacterium]|nr:CARDB domain-containing protein [Gaiellaceae bacterium]